MAINDLRDVLMNFIIALRCTIIIHARYLALIAILHAHG